MSQRTADELENRRGLTLGLTLAEVLLLLLFVVMLALSWRMIGLEREHQLTERILRREVTRLHDANAELTATLRGVQAIGSNPDRLWLANDAIALAAEMNPNDPAEALMRAVTTLKRLGADAQPDQVRPLSEMRTDSEKLNALDGAIALGMQINPSDPAEALTRAAQILVRLGADAKPDEVVPIEQIKSMSSDLQRAVSERDNLMRGGNGLTYPSCWRMAEGKTQYIFDVTIRDAGMIVRDATPTRASDPDLKLVAGVARNELINEKVFDNETGALFKYSQSENCRFYSIVRDDTGSTNKARYKKMLSIVESHFYKLLRPELSTDVPMGGPYQPPKP